MSLSSLLDILENWLILARIFHLITMIDSQFCLQYENMCLGHSDKCNRDTTHKLMLAID